MTRAVQAFEAQGVEVHRILLADTDCASLPEQESVPKVMVVGAGEFVTAINLDVLCAAEAGRILVAFRPSAYRLVDPEHNLVTVEFPN